MIDQTTGDKNQKEALDHKAYKKSMMPRFLCRASVKRAKSDEKASKEERQYAEALNAEN